MDETACPSCGKANPPGFAFCGFCGHALTASAFPWFPTEERKVVTVLFADLSDFTALGGRLDPEVIREIVARFFAASREEIRKFAGSVEKFIGDAVMAVFGLPQTHEDDPVRAVRAALAIRQRLNRLNDEFRSGFSVTVAIHIGIDTGEVMAAAGPAEGRDFLVTGEPVNMAARLEKLARPNQILTGERTYRFARGHFQFHPLGPLDVKGRDEPLPAWEVAGALPTALGSRVVGRFVGRDKELAQLRAHFDEVVASRRPRLVTVVGLPGLGKSRLFHEFVASLAASDVIPVIRTGRCLPYGEAITYLPLADILKEECGILDSDPPLVAREKVVAALSRLGAADVVDVLGYSIGLEFPETQIRQLDPRFVGQELVRAWRVFFESKARSQPLVVQFEDLHWAADALLELIESVIGAVTGVPLLAVGTARPDLLERRQRWGHLSENRTAMFLDALSPVASELLLDDLLPGDLLPPPLRTSILARAEGNPFFLEEMVRMLQDEEIVVHRSGQWQIGKTGQGIVLPDTVQGVIATRIDRLAVVHKAVLQQAAVIGRTFWLGALRTLASSADVADAIDALERKDFIRERPRSTLVGELEYTFKHVLIREVAYSSLPRAARGRMHQQVAQWLEHVGAHRLPESVELLAYHYQEAARLTAAEASRVKAGTYLRQAAENAQRRYALQQAMSYAQSALEFVDEPQRPGVQEDLADTLFLAGRFAEAEALYREALTGRTRPLERARIHRKIVPTLKMDRAMEELERARAELALEPDAAEEATILMWMGRFAYRRMEYLEATDFYQRARGMLQRSGSRTDLARCLYYLGNTLIHLGRYAEAFAVAEELQVLAGDLRDSPTLRMAYRLLGEVQLYRGENAEALRAADLVLQTGEAATPDLMAGGLRRKGRVLSRLGRLREAVEVLQEALNLSEQAEYPEEPRAIISEDLAIVLADLGRVEEARAVVAQGVRMAEATGFGEPMVGIAVAALHVATLAGRPLDSVGQCEMALQRWPNSRAITVKALAAMAEAWAMSGAPTRAEDPARRCHEIASADGAVHGALLARRTLGHFAVLQQRWSEAVQHLGEAAAGFLQSGAQLEWGRAIGLLAEATVGLGQIDQARVLLDQAREVLGECGATEDLRRLEKTRAQLTIKSDVP